jgi:hypothetical protein
MMLAIYIAAGLCIVLALIGAALVFGSPRNPDDDRPDQADPSDLQRMP